MEWFDTCTPPSTRAGVHGTLDAARARLADANVALRVALGTEADWVSVAADAYRARIEDRLRDLRRHVDRLDALEALLRGASNARVNSAGA